MKTFRVRYYRNLHIVECFIQATCRINAKAEFKRLYGDDKVIVQLNEVTK